MLSSILLMAIMGTTAECKQGMRDDPVLIVKDSRKHYIYFLPSEMQLCENYKELFLSGVVNRVCGCKIVKSNDLDDRLRLKCLERRRGVLKSKTVATYYYYPAVTKSCLKLRNHLMFKAK